MLRQLLIASCAFAGCVALHAYAMVITTETLGPWLRHKGETGSIVITMICVVGCLGVFHFIEVCLWALVMTLSGAVPSADALYFAFTSYTTLGYGDVLATEPRQLLGPASAMNGILLFGWSTALVFQVMNEAYHLRDRNAVSDTHRDQN